jgi:2'-5' RNA ligase
MVQSIELLPDAATEAHIRGEWQQLTAAGLPSQGQHSGASNRPHITLGVAGQLTAEQEIDVASAVRGRVPCPLRLRGLLVFGSGPFVLTRAVVPTVELLDVQQQVARNLPSRPGSFDQQGPGAWSAHLTLARRLDARQLAAAVSALHPIDELVGQAVAVRRWDGDRKVDWLLS